MGRHVSHSDGTPVGQNDRRAFNIEYINESCARGTGKPVDWNGDSSRSARHRDADCIYARSRKTVWRRISLLPRGEFRGHSFVVFETTEFRGPGLLLSFKIWSDVWNLAFVVQKKLLPVLHGRRIG